MCHNFYSNFIVNHTWVLLIIYIYIIPSVTKKTIMFLALECMYVILYITHCNMGIFIFETKSYIWLSLTKTYAYSHMPFLNHYHILKKIRWPIDILSIYRCPRFCQIYPEYELKKKSPSVMIGAVCTSRSELTTLQRNRQILKIWLS